MFSFNFGSINRIWYVILLASLIAFQYAQRPLEKFVNHKLEQQLNNNVTAINSLATFSQLSESDQKKFAGVKEKLDKMVSDDNMPPETRELIEGAKTVLDDSTQPQSDRPDFSKDIIDPTTTYWSQLILFLGVIGLFNNFALLWLIMARVQDIGWGHATGLGLFSPYFIILFTGPPAPVFQILYALFLIILAALALIPSNFKMFGDDLSDNPVQSAVSSKQELAVTPVPPRKAIRPNPPSFGKR